MGQGRLLLSTLSLKLQSKDLVLLKYTARKKELLSLGLHVSKCDMHNQISLKNNYFLS